MARPRKLGLDWFPFHANTFDDRKMLSLISRRGSSAFALLIFLKSEIFHNSYFVEADDFLMEKALRHFCELDEESYTSLLDTFVEWGFFDNTTYLAHKVLTSVDIQHDYFYVADRRKIDPEQLKYLLVEFPITEENSKETAKKTAKNSSKKSTKKTTKKQQSNEAQNAESEHDSESSGVSACKRREDKSREEKTKQEENKFSHLTRSGEACGHASSKGEGEVPSVLGLNVSGETVATKAPKAKPKKAGKAKKQVYSAIDNPDYAAQKAFYENRACMHTVDELVRLRLNDQQWRETVQRNNGVKDSEIPALLERFALNYREQLRPERTTNSSFSIQFSIWVKYHLEAARREASYIARMAQRDANHAARMEAREAKYDARMERRDAKFDARIEQQKRSQPHQFECEKNYVPRLNIITFGKDVPTESGFDLPDFNQA
jgi:hypothetical protein